MRDMIDKLRILVCIPTPERGKRGNILPCKSQEQTLSPSLKILQPAVSLAVKRGEQLVIRHNYSLKA